MCGGCFHRGEEANCNKFSDLRTEECEGEEESYDNNNGDVDGDTVAVTTGWMTLVFIMVVLVQIKKNLIISPLFPTS